MELHDDDFEEIRKLLRDWSGLSLSMDKHYLVRSRLEPIIHRHQMITFSELVKRLESGNDRTLRNEVVEAMVTNETSFNRDGHPYEELRRKMMPKWIRLLHDRSGPLHQIVPKIKIWSLASSTGQEPYSIAMSILDSLETSQAGWSSKNFSILASDISERALQVARSGIYSDFDVERGLTFEQRMKHFFRTDRNWKINPNVQEMVDFRRLNILQGNLDLTGFDAIFCRNLLFYFDEQTRSNVCWKIANALLPGGMLILGAAEQLPANNDKLFTRCELGNTIVYLRAS